MTNDMNEAMERAANAMDDYWHSKTALPPIEFAPKEKLGLVRATIAAFLRSAPVSEGMEKAGSTELTGIPFIGADRLRIAYKAMSTQLADEIEGMSNGQ